MTDISSVIGRHLADDLSMAQTAEVEAAIIENEAGVRRVAAEVMTSNANSPTAVLLSRLRRGQHRNRSRTQQRNDANELSALERAELAYHAKIAHLNEHHALTPEGDWTQEDAMAYAIDYTKGANDTTERELRHRLMLAPQPASVPAPVDWQAMLRTLTEGTTEA